MPINQPVFIHSLFSLSPDRASFYSQDESAAKWNEYLVRVPITIAWSNLLLHMASICPNQSTFEWFPRFVESPNDPLMNPLKNVLSTIVKDSLPLWWTEIGHSRADEGLLNVGAKSLALREALREAKVPVVYAPDGLHSHVQHIFNGRHLDPQRLFSFLASKNDQIRDWSHDTKMSILEYLLSDGAFTEIGTLELFPFKDGNYRSIANYDAFICRNDLEVDLFGLQNDHNVDVEKLSRVAASVLHGWCQSSIRHEWIRYRSTSDFRDYCLKAVFVKPDSQQDMVYLDIEAASFVMKAWSWIVKQDINDLGAMSDLWIIPLTSGHYRKYKPCLPESETFLSPTGPIGEFMEKFDVKFSSKVKPLVKKSELSSLAQEILAFTARSDSSLRIKDGNKMADFSRWLYHIQAIVNSAPDEEKDELVETLVSNFQTSENQSDYHSIRKNIGSLQIFKKVAWKEGSSKDENA